MTALASALALLGGCATPTDPGSTASAATQTATPATAAVVAAPASRRAGGQVLGRSDKLLIYVPQNGDQLRGIAERFLGRADLDWMIAAANGHEPATPGVPLVVPLRAINPLGIGADQVQTVPILCYHKFGTNASKMVIPPARFAAQLDWLARNGYHVVRLSEVKAFLAGKQALPAKSVAITIDDGYESVHRYAFPALRKHGFAATLFVYTDFMGGGDALRWPQIQEMAASGLVDIQSHSKSHRNLAERQSGETDDRYAASLQAEMQVPREIIEKRVLGTKVRHMAYPYGDANAQVADVAEREGYELGLTVVPGGNAFYSPAMMLRRTMIFGDLDLEGFKAKLQISRPLQAP